MHSSRSEPSNAIRQMAGSRNLPEVYAVEFQAHIVGRPRQENSADLGAQSSPGAASLGLAHLQMQIMQCAAGAHLAELDLLQRKFVHAQLAFRVYVAQKF